MDSVSRDLRSLAGLDCRKASWFGSGNRTDLRADECRLRNLQPPTGMSPSDNPVMQLTTTCRTSTGAPRFSLSLRLAVQSFLWVPDQEIRLQPGERCVITVAFRNPHPRGDQRENLDSVEELLNRDAKPNESAVSSVI
jgi:hypothetical protein